MSSIGLNTNTFRITGKYLDLLNDFVVKARINQEIEEGQKDLLVGFINQLKDENNHQPQFLVLSNIIERELRSTNENYRHYLESIMTEIEENNINAFLPKIEFLTDILDMENSEALLKIMGE
ncbi:hypothetical protein [Spirosoma endophyticum]|uniref:Uncharacterized protein n=1 Tax=Spirosoma endophyticum TaxID=662367 RepID=A0A1I2BAA7_9BACT|nr:hypothetical protein [Spirosoma endophyticum]SFE53009.1 hypothetical protein SAMN05216167_11539 [Spirosoma endophyticum]